MNGMAVTVVFLAKPAASLAIRHGLSGKPAAYAPKCHSPASHESF